jgi:23S rRNA pseudouridine2457 synthase
MSTTPHRYFALYKPYNMVSQFVSTHDVNNLLTNIDFPFPEHTHAIGRLDNLSEGLLLLTTNKKVTRLLFQGEVPHERTYLVKVKNVVTEETLKQLNEGVTIRIEGGAYYTTPPCRVEIVERPADLPPLPNDIAVAYPHTWLTITLTEGKFHQVRKMVAAVHHRCQRLVRISIEDILLDGLQPGCIREIEEEEFFRRLKIANWR